ncbi:hypothetical protein [Chryseobacterium sp. c4a]|uniref:hypothetical protein n=1 Tax=Chryseobacterium sp. c4a TaxID=1573582 RepID=UPI00135C7A76|nr:hypothetical protein [Chryseobacterium sp. c4a]
MKRLSAVFLLFISILGSGQARQMWKFEFEFSIKSQKNTSYQYQDLEVFVNEASTYLRESELKYNPVSKKYNVLLSYTCFGCGEGYNCQPPELYLKLNMEDISFSNPKQFSALIPVYFQELPFDQDKLNENEVIRIGEINVDRFLSKDANTYEGIEMLSPFAKKHSKKGEYIPRKITRMVHVPLLTNSNNKLK